MIADQNTITLYAYMTIRRLGRIGYVSRAHNNFGRNLIVVTIFEIEFQLYLYLAYSTNCQDR